MEESDLPDVLDSVTLCSGATSLYGRNGSLVAKSGER